MSKNRISRRTNFFSLVIITCLGALLLLGTVAEAATRAEVQKWIIEEAELARVPPALALAVAKVESNFRDDALGSQGERGVMQIMPTTAQGEFGIGPGLLWDGRLNVKLGLRYLERLYKQYGRRWNLALSHYNGGTLKGRGANAIPHSYNRKYVADVLGWRNTFERRNLVTQIKHSVEVASVSEASRRRPGSLPIDYWMLDDPEIERGWRHYVNVASYWLMPENERKRVNVKNHAESRYSENMFQNGNYSDRVQTHYRPSDNWMRGVEKTRESFRRHIRGHEDLLEPAFSWYRYSEHSEFNGGGSVKSRYTSRPSDILKRDTEKLRELFRRHLRGSGNHLSPVFS
jgi:hypothetical protein